MASLLQEALAHARKLDRGMPARYSRWCPQTPTEKQALFLESNEVEGLFGGAVGGAKSSALLMAALQYVDVPGYSALIVRKTFKDLIKADALVPRAQDWLSGTAAKGRDGGLNWKFPSGATLEFGHMEDKDSHYQYQSSAFQFIGFDELTQHREEQYLYLFSRARRLANSNVPLRIRGTTNPGGTGSDWVEARFIAGYDGVSEKYVQQCETDLGEPFGKVTGERFFIKSLLSDNPHIDMGEYLLTLANLPPLERERLLKGDWSIRPEGLHFLLEWFDRPGVRVKSSPRLKSYVRAWDTGLTRTGDPSCGTLMGPEGRNLWLLHQVEQATDVPGLTDLIVRTAQDDPEDTLIAVEETGISLPLLYQLRNHPKLAGKRIIGVPVAQITGKGQGNDKLSRMSGWMNKLADGDVRIVDGPWVEPFIAEALMFRNEKGERSPNRLDSVSVGNSQVFKQKGAFIDAKREPEVGSPAWYREERKWRKEAQSRGGFFR